MVRSVRLGMVLSLMLVLALALTLALAGPARAGEDVEQDRVRRAVERGEMLPLATILAAIRPRLPGEVAGVEVERHKGKWLYEFRVVDEKGRLYEVYVDAKTAEIERIKAK